MSSRPWMPSSDGHNGATSRGTARRGEEIVLDNLRRFVSAEPLRNVVDKTAGY